jgi:hypothetical protein
LKIFIFLERHVFANFCSLEREMEEKTSQVAVFRSQKIRLGKSMGKGGNSSFHFVALSMTMILNVMKKKLYLPYAKHKTFILSEVNNLLDLF